MNPLFSILAKDLAKQLNLLVNLPFVSEEEEEMFFRLVVTKVFEIAFGHILKVMENPPKQT